MNWIMTMAEKPDPSAPSYAEPVHPSDARAVVLTSDFAELFTILRGWQRHLMPEGEFVTAYAFPATLTPSGAVAPETLAEWDAGDERMIRLDYQPGGFIKIRHTDDAAPNGRPPFPRALPAAPVRPALTARQPEDGPAVQGDGVLYPPGTYELRATLVTPEGPVPARGEVYVDGTVTHREIKGMTVITSTGSAFGHRFLSVDGGQECLTCGAHFDLVADPDDPTRGDYVAAFGADPTECTGDTSQPHGEDPCRNEDCEDEAPCHHRALCNCRLCTG